MRNQPMSLAPVTLSGRTVRLEPLSLAHVPGLAAVGLDPALWRWIPTPVATVEEMRAYVATALDAQQRGLALPFALVDRHTEQVIGSTRYGNIDVTHRRVEIGWTWIAASHQRTSVNSEAKLLLLTHAFETLGAIRVELKTDALNERSRRAIRRIGAVEEGTLRRHMITASGRVRDSVYFSVLDDEWPAVRARLTELTEPRSGERS
ncbi:MAG: GNAT family N-acetyltransferase [Polyangiales bacterium]